LKFSLINASSNEELEDRERARAIASLPPLGILYLAAVLKGYGVEVSVLDQPAKGLTVEEAGRWAEKEDPGILGFSATGSSGKTAANICSKVKERNPGIITVFGNHYATLNPDRILAKYSSVDVIVR